MGWRTLFRRPKPEPERPAGAKVYPERPAGAKVYPERPARQVFLEAPLPEKVPEPVPLVRVFPPLDAADQELGETLPNNFSEDEIATALALLRGGMVRSAEGGYRATRPARFQIAMRHIKGFAEQCLSLHGEAKLRAGELYAAYLVWTADADIQPVLRSDFDFAMSDYLAMFGGHRTLTSFVGCRIRPEHVKRMADVRGVEIKKRLGMGLEELMTGGRK